MSIAVDPSGNPWVTNNDGFIYRWTGTAWAAQPGCAVDVGIGANGQTWVVGCTPANGGFAIYSWNGSDWVNQPGGAFSIAVDPSGAHPWVTNDEGFIYSS
jgi:hypothetical protein